MTHDLFQVFGNTFHFHVEEIVISDLQGGRFLPRLLCPMVWRNMRLTLAQRCYCHRLAIWFTNFHVWKHFSRSGYRTHRSRRRGRARTHRKERDKSQSEEREKKKNQLQVVRKVRKIWRITVLTSSMSCWKKPLRMKITSVRPSCAMS